MDKQKFFQKLVKANRKQLLYIGFSPAILTMYVQGTRFPSENSARKIAKLTGEKLEKFPYMRRN